MPEIGEVARIVHYLKKHIVGKTIAAVKVQEDEIIYGKVGTSAGAFQKAMTGRQVLDARQQGKYFWLVMDKPPHPVMHFGMTGWMRFSNDDSSYYKPTKVEDDEWPPRFWKFVLETAEEPKTQAAFVDARRLARIRLVDADGEDLRKTSPLKENGPDPVVDRDVLTVEWFANKMRSKKVPVKAFLLDQANISGVGNWVADEILYNAKVHPEQYSNTFSDEQLKELHASLHHICHIAVDTLADSARFPEEWLMKHRWGKGKKDQNVLPNGEKIVHLKVGGRTSAIVPSVQKKTGPVAGDVSADSNGQAADGEGDGEDVTPKRGSKRKSTEKSKSTQKPTIKANVAKSRGGAGKIKKAESGNEEETAGKTKRKRPVKKAANGKKADEAEDSDLDLSEEAEEVEAEGVDEDAEATPRTTSTRTTKKRKAKTDNDVNKEKPSSSKSVSKSATSTSKKRKVSTTSVPQGAQKTTNGETPNVKTYRSAEVSNGRRRSTRNRG